jgi:hypothetical protein
MDVALGALMIVVLFERAGTFTTKATQTAVYVYVNHQHVLNPLFLNARVHLQMGSSHFFLARDRASLENSFDNSR